MKSRIATAAATALALVAVPTMAQAETPRQAAPVEGENDMIGGAGLIIGILAIAAIVGGIIISTSDDDEDPVSF